jgi:hypothetical protein
VVSATSPLDFVNGTFTESGVLTHITAPGSGIVSHESGRIITSLADDSVIFMAEPHQLFTGDEAEFCAALGDPQTERGKVSEPVQTPVQTRAAPKPEQRKAPRLRGSSIAGAGFEPATSGL